MSGTDERPPAAGGENGGDPKPVQDFPGVKDPVPPGVDDPGGLGPTKLDPTRW